MMADITKALVRIPCVYASAGGWVGGQHWRREGLAPTAAAPTLGSATPCQML